MRGFSSMLSLFYDAVEQFNIGAQILDIFFHMTLKWLSHEESAYILVLFIWYFLEFLSLYHVCPGSGEVLECIDSWSLLLPYFELPILARNPSDFVIMYATLSWTSLYNVTKYVNHECMDYRYKTIGYPTDIGECCLELGSQRIESTDLWA